MNESSSLVSIFVLALHKIYNYYGEYSKNKYFPFLGLALLNLKFVCWLETWREMSL